MNGFLINTSLLLLFISSHILIFSLHNNISLTVGAFTCQKRQNLTALSEISILHSPRVKLNVLILSNFI